ncbi:hypothetical protein [Xanthomonas citri]|uniref:hypothetical protein n=1 Tax=Xanthomonas citri TaxID=346 RepID=UPI001F24FB4F|nr:hypothetical protein [Xanthomonas citri]
MLPDQETDDEPSTCSTGRITVGPVTFESIHFKGANAAKDLDRFIKTILNIALKNGCALPGPTQQPAEKGKVLFLNSEIAKYIESMEGECADPTNISTTEHSLKIFLGVIGDKAIGEIEPDDISTFKNALRWWPPNATRKREFDGLSISEIIQKGKANNLPEPSANTTNNHMAKVNKFFNNLVAKRKLAHSPMQGVELRIRHSGPIEERLFGPHDLEAIFKEEDYVAWVNGKPHLYWTPLIAYCTGARLMKSPNLNWRTSPKSTGDCVF